MTKSDDNNAMECRVGLAVAASVEPMAVGLARRYGIDTAEGGEGSLGVEAVRVTPGSNEEGRRRVWSWQD